MENNTPVPEALAQTPIPQKSSGFNPLWLLLVVAAVLVIAGVVIYSQNQSRKATQQQEVTKVQEVKTLETELNTLDDGTSDTDLTALEKDLQNL